MYTSQQLIGYVFPIGACCLSCMTKEEIAKAETSPAFAPIRKDISLGDGEIVCAGCEEVLQEGVA